MRRCILSMVVLLFSAQCAIAAQNKGTPEITIYNVSRKQVIDQIMRAKLERGMKIRSVSDHGVIASKVMDSNLGASILFGSRYDINPEARIIYNVIEIENAVKIFMRFEMVTNPGSSFERISDLTEGKRKDILKELNDYKVMLEGR